LPEGFSIAKKVMSGLAKKPEDRPETCGAIFGLSTESASCTRYKDLLEATKVIFAEVKSVYDDHVAKRHFIDEISAFISKVRGCHELRDESGVFACLREVEQLKVEVEKTSAGTWQELHVKFRSIREKTEAEVRSALEKNREKAEKRRLAEEARRQQEELKKRQELEEQKRREQAEIKSCREKVDAVKHDITQEYGKVVEYTKADPDYGDCLPIAQEICASTNEKEPEDLPGICERLKKLERNLERIRSLISSHDLVVCATLNDVEVGSASMLYGERRIAIPVRIKRRHRLTQDEGYLLEYACRNQKYYGWFSPSCVKSSDGQYAMVPLHKEPSISEIARVYREKKLERFLWNAIVAFVISAEVSYFLVGCVAYGCFIKCGWHKDACIVAAIFCGVVFGVLGCCFLYCWLMRREMRCAICDNSQYRMLPQSTFDESVLLLNRKERPASEMFKEFKPHNWVKFFWHLLVALYFSLHIVLLVGYLVNLVFQHNKVAVVLGGLLAFLVAFFFSCRRALRREQMGNFIGLDDYRAKRVESPTVKEVEETSVEEEPVQTRKSQGQIILWVVAVCILVFVGLCCRLCWKNIQAEKSYTSQAKSPEKPKEEWDKVNNIAKENHKEEEAAKKRHSEDAELNSFREEIAHKVRFAGQKVSDAKKYRRDPVGFTNHLAVLDEAYVELVELKNKMPKTAAKTNDFLISVNDACGKISSELAWLSKNEPLRGVARRIEEEMKSELDAELDQFQSELSANGSDRYSQGLSLRQEGNAALEKGDFDLARRKLDEAKAKLTDALAEAKKIAADRSVKLEAIELFNKGSWQDGLKLAEKVKYDKDIQFYIGTCYNFGYGVNRDPQMAREYFRRAAEKGQLDAKRELNRLGESSL